MGVAGVGLDGVMCGDVRRGVRIAACWVQVGELIVNHAVFAEDAAKIGSVGLANRFAVPACAFGVELFKHVLVGLAGPGEGGGEFCFVDFVIVAEELLRLTDGMGEVGWW